MANNALMQSNDILVFPSSRRSSTQLSSRYMQEQTYTDIINSVCTYNNGTFINTQPLNDGNDVLYYSTSAPFEFYIHGYKFIIKQLSVLLDKFSSADQTQIWAYIDLDDYVIDESKNDHRFELIGRDGLMDVGDGTQISNYQGITFTDTEPVDTQNRYKIKLFDRSNVQSGASTQWNVNFYKESLYRMSVVGFPEDIDGGEIR